MADPKTDDDKLPDKAEEARNLAREAVEEMRHGDREEGKFLAEEATELDPKAAREVLAEGHAEAGTKAPSKATLSPKGKG